MFSLEEIRLCRESRRKYPQKSYKDNLPSFNDPGRKDQSYLFSRGDGISIVAIGVIQALDELLRKVEAAQPVEAVDFEEDPEWYSADYDEIWYAV
jgi:hypothetical protein